MCIPSHLNLDTLWFDPILGLNRRKVDEQEPLNGSGEVRSQDRSLTSAPLWCDLYKIEDGRFDCRLLFVGDKQRGKYLHHLSDVLYYF